MLSCRGMSVVGFRSLLETVRRDDLRSSVSVSVSVAVGVGVMRGRLLLRVVTRYVDCGAPSFSKEAILLYICTPLRSVNSLRTQRLMDSC